MHRQTRLIGDFASVHLFIGQRIIDYPQFKENFKSIRCNLDLKVMRPNPMDDKQIADFIKGLNCQHKIMLLVGGLCPSI